MMKNFDQTSKSKKNKSEENNKIRKRKRILLMMSFFGILFILVVVAKLMSNTPIINSEDSKYIPSSTVYDINGKIYQQLKPSDGTIYTYFTDAVYTQVLNDLVEKYHYTYDVASNMILNNNLKIYSTVDPTVQKALEDQAANADNFPAQSSSAVEASAAMTAYIGTKVNYIPQLGGVVIQNKTGYVAGIIGGRGKTASLTRDRALQKNQIGSTTKPLTVYAPGINEHLLTLDMKFNNAVLAQEKIGVDISADYGEKFGLIITRSGSSNDMNPEALALGEYIYGQTPLAVASAYTVFPNGGYRITPTFYTTVEDSKGNVILSAQQTNVQVITVDTAYQVTTVLKDDVQGETTTRSIPGQQIGGTTGTSDNEIYAWFTGFTSQYTASFWWGYDENIVTAGEKKYNLSIGIDGGGTAGPAQYWELVFRQFYTSKNLPDGTLPDEPK